MAVEEDSRALSASFESAVDVWSGTTEADFRADSSLDRCFRNVSDAGFGSNLLELLAKHLRDSRIVASWGDGGVDADESAC